MAGPVGCFLIPLVKRLLTFWSDELRHKAVKTAIAVVSGGYQTALVSYFINRDFFPALMKVLVRILTPGHTNTHQLVLQPEDSLRLSEPLLLTGLLGNYNKFEVTNQ